MVKRSSNKKDGRLTHIQYYFLVYMLEIIYKVIKTNSN